MRQRERLNERCTLEGLSWFQHSQKRFVRFRVGSAHTDISLHIHAALCHSHEGDEQCVCQRARQTQRESMRLWEKCNPLAVLEHPLETPTCYIHTHAPPWQCCSEAFQKYCMATVALFCCDDLMVNKPAWKETPCSFSTERRREWITVLKLSFMASPCFVRHSTLHLSGRHLSHPVPIFHCNQGGYYVKWRAHQQHRIYSTFWLTIGCNHLTQNLSESVVMWYLVINNYR